MYNLTAQSSYFNLSMEKGDFFAMDGSAFKSETLMDSSSATFLTALASFSFSFLVYKCECENGFFSLKTKFLYPCSLISPTILRLLQPYQRLLLAKSFIKAVRQIVDHKNTKYSKKIQQKFLWLRAITDYSLQKHHYRPRVF